MCVWVCACVYLCVTEFIVPSVRRCRLDVWQLLTWPSVQPFKFNFWSLAVKATSDSDLMDVSLSPQWSVRGSKWHFSSFFSLFSKQIALMVAELPPINSLKFKDTLLMRLNSVFILCCIYCGSGYVYLFHFKYPKLKRQISKSPFYAQITETPHDNFSFPWNPTRWSYYLIRWFDSRVF